MRIKVLTGYDGVTSKEGKACPYWEQAEAHYQEYCDRWGYQFVPKWDDWEPLDRRGGDRCLVRLSWRKHPFIRRELVDCDWLLWLDADCKILNMTIPLESFIEDGIDMVITGPFGVPCHCGHEAHSTGVLLFRNCEWTRGILREWWDSDKERPGWRTGSYSKCFSMSDNNWLSCKFMPNDPRTDHVKVLGKEIAGHCHFHRDPKQFLMHLYGGEPNARKDLMAWLETKVIR